MKPAIQDILRNALEKRLKYHVERRCLRKDKAFSWLVPQNKSLFGRLPKKQNSPKSENLHEQEKANQHSSGEAFSQPSPIAKANGDPSYLRNLFYRPE